MAPNSGLRRRLFHFLRLKQSPSLAGLVRISETRTRDDVGRRQVHIMRGMIACILSIHALLVALELILTQSVYWF